MLRTLRVRLTVATALALVLIASTLTAASASTDPNPRRIVTGWLPFWTQERSLASATANGDLWSEASPFWYQATSATAITRHEGAGSRGVVDELRSKGIKVVPTVTETLDAPAMGAMLNDRAQRTAHVKTLVNLVEANGYDGIDLDYEAMNFGTTGTRAQRAAQTRAVRRGFVALVNELGAALHAKGTMLTVAVGPRTSADDPGWAVFDYAGIAKAVDRVRIMAYDYHWSGGDPGPIAPLPWVEKVLDYAVTAIPRGHIQVGIPLYGQDWVCGNADCTSKARGTRAKPLTYKKAEQRREAEDATREWSTRAAAPSYTYTDSAGAKHVVWYNDAAATAAKLALVETYRLAGLAFWSVGAEDPAQWAELRGYATNIAKQEVGIGASAPDLVLVGRPAEITGFVRDADGAPVSGHAVALQRREAGSDGWTEIATQTSSPTGAVDFSDTPTGASDYRLQSAATWAYDAATSGEVTVEVNATPPVQAPLPKLTR